MFSCVSLCCELAVCVRERGRERTYTNMHTYQADREKAEKDLEQIDDNDDTDSDVARELEMFAGMSHAFFDNNEDVELRPVTEEGDDREARGSTSSVLKAEEGDADGTVVTRDSEPVSQSSPSSVTGNSSTCSSSNKTGSAGS